MTAFDGEILRYDELIPVGLIKGFKLKYGLFTTFGLENRALSEMLVNLEALSLCKENALDVYADINAINTKSGKDYDEYNIVPAECFHWVNNIKDNKPYAFHPKIILLRYESENDKTIRYFVIMLSKNITFAQHLDCFGICYGDVSNTSGFNGKTMRELIKDSLPEPYHCENLLDELERTKFGTLDNETAVQFLKGSGVKKKIKAQEKLIVVSPFISQFEAPTDWGWLQKEGNLIVSMENQLFSGGKAQKRVLSNKILEKTGPLHAKVYIGWNKNENKTTIIVGSSNCTYNGLDDKNVELNMCFEKEGDDVYNDAEKNLFGISQRIDEQDIQKNSTEETDNIKLLIRMAKAFLWDCISCKYKEDKSVEISCDEEGFLKKLNIQQYQCDVKIGEGSLFRNGVAVKNPGSCVVGTINLHDKEKPESNDFIIPFIIPLYKYIQQKEFEAELNQKAQNNLKRLGAMQIERILRGKSARPFRIDKDSILSSESEKGTSGYIRKAFLEKMMDMIANIRAQDAQIIRKDFLANVNKIVEIAETTNNSTLIDGEFKEWLKKQQNTRN